MSNLFNGRGKARHYPPFYQGKKAKSTVYGAFAKFFSVFSSAQDRFRRLYRHPLSYEGTLLTPNS